MASNASDEVEVVETIPLYLRVDPELHRRVAVDAARHRRSMNQHAAAILDAAVPPAELPAEVG